MKKHKEECSSTTKRQEKIKVDAFIQNIHKFRDDYLSDASAPNEKVVIFDEAQRAWDQHQTSKFMQQKKGKIGFSMSEPEFLLSVMDRHDDWCAVVCLVGIGQEINTGEAGISEWLRALERSFPHWLAHAPTQLSSLTNCILHNVQTTQATTLHLETCIRSFRSERLSDFVGLVLDGNAAAASQMAASLCDYNVFVTRDLQHARAWLRKSCRGSERMGLLASSNAARLKPEGIFVKSKIDPVNWFLAPSDDVRSSNALEDTATEFDVQGLELDWACMCWDANFRRSASSKGEGGGAGKRACSKAASGSESTMTPASHSSLIRTACCSRELGRGLWCMSPLEIWTDPTSRGRPKYTTTYTRICSAVVCDSFPRARALKWCSDCGSFSIRFANRRAGE